MLLNACFFVKLDLDWVIVKMYQGLKKKATSAKKSVTKRKDRGPTGENLRFFWQVMEIIISDAKIDGDVKKAPKPKQLKAEVWLENKLFNY